MDYLMIAIILLIIGIAATVLMEVRQKKRNIEFKSIFPDTYDEWTDKVFELGKMKDRTRRKKRNFSKRGSSASGFVYDDSKNNYDPYDNPGMDAFVDETHHGMDRGMGIVNDHHHDFDPPDTGDPHHH